MNPPGHDDQSAGEPPSWSPPAAPAPAYPPPLTPPPNVPPGSYPAPGYQATPTPPPPPGPSAAPYAPSAYPPVPGPPTPPPLSPYAVGPGGPGQPPFYGPPPGAPDPAGPRRGQGRVVFAVISVFALLFGAGFVVWSVTRPDGASDPEQAVRNLFDSIDNEDLIGALETLPPSERAILRDATLDAVKDLQRLGVLSDFDEHKVPGATFDVQNLQLTSSQLGPDVVAVKVVGGTISGTANANDLPIGDVAREKAKDDLATTKPETFHEDLARDHLTFAAVRENGGWHVSLFYSIAEAARGPSGPVPAFGHGPAPLGSDTPEDAVREMVRAGTDLDPELAIRMLPPDEMKVVYDYSSIFLPDAQKSAEKAKADGFHARIDRLDLRAEGDGDTRRVYSSGFDATAGDQYTETHITYDGQCYSVQDDHLQRRSNYGAFGPDERQEICRDGTVRVNGTTDARTNSTMSPLNVIGNTTADVGITVVQVGGRWYVSPTRTLVDTLLTGLHSIKREDVQRLFDGNLFGSSSSSGTFSTTPRLSEIPNSTRPPTTSGTIRPRSTTTIDPFCEDYPDDPDCQGLSPTTTTRSTRRSTTTTETSDPNDGGLSRPDDPPVN